MHKSVTFLGSVSLTEDMSSQIHITGQRSYELTNHLGNVLSAISDMVIPYDDNADDVVDWYLADILQATDYSPFGVTLHNRNFTKTGAEKFRFGFNDMEADDDVKGDGNSYDFGARMLDPRIGRWLTIDAKTSKYPQISPYSFVNDRPVIAVDPDGNDVIFVIDGKTYNVTSSTLSILPDGDLKNTFIDLVSTEIGKQYFDYFAQGGAYADKVDVYIGAAANAGDEVGGSTKILQSGKNEKFPDLSNYSEEFIGSGAAEFNEKFKDQIIKNQKMIFGILLNQDYMEGNRMGNADSETGIFGSFIVNKTALHELLHDYYKIVPPGMDEHKAMGSNNGNSAVQFGSPLHTFLLQSQDVMKKRIDDLKKSEDSNKELIEKLSSEVKAIDAYLESSKNEQNTND